MTQQWIYILSSLGVIVLALLLGSGIGGMLYRIKDRD